VNHLRWQGLCREIFLRDHAPDVLGQLANGLVLSTLRCSCEYLAELAAFDELRIRMRLGELRQNRITLRFEYFRVADGGEQLAARGEQQIACMRREGGALVATPLPASLRAALAEYAEL
jgi:enediyne biosynthesis thioesterase